MRFLTRAMFVLFTLLLCHTTLADGLTAPPKGTLHYAAWFGQVSQAEKMLRKQPQLINASIKPNGPPLFCALENLELADNRKFAMVAFLLKKGANPNLAHPESKFTPLMCLSGLVVTDKQKIALARMLLDAKAKINTQDDTGDTALTHYYSHDPHSIDKPDYVELLLAKGADPNTKDWRGQTPLFTALNKLRSPALVKMLLEHGADPNIQDKDGRTPLIELSNHAYYKLLPARLNMVLEMARLLLAKGADARRVDNDKFTARHYLETLPQHNKKIKPEDWQPMVTLLREAEERGSAGKN